MARRQLTRAELTAYPEAQPSRQVASIGDMMRLAFARVPRNEVNRPHFGRGLTPERIEVCIRNATAGYMRDLTDLAHETMALDPHLSSTVSKRVNAVAAAPWDVVPASGPGVDQGRAELYAEVAREQLNRLDKFGQRRKQLAWGLFDGRAALENHWVHRMPDQRGVQWHLAQQAWLHPRRISFGPERELRIVDDLYQGYNFAPVGVAMRDWYGKFVEFSPQLFGEYPEREGLAPRCLYWSFFKRFSARDRMILLELFGRPWRIVTVAEDSNVDPLGLEKAAEIADELGSTTTARMPRGTELEVVQVGDNAGEQHGDVIAESDRQISKLVLGQTGTTDGVPAGLNSNQTAIMQDEQLLVFQGDCDLLAEAIEDGMVDPIIALNFGHGELLNSPRFVLKAEVPPDRAQEGARLKAALDAGLEVAVDEAYEVLGFRKPEENEARLRMADSGFGTRAPELFDPDKHFSELEEELQRLRRQGAPAPTEPEEEEEDPPSPGQSPEDDTEEGGLEAIAAEVATNADAVARRLATRLVLDMRGDPDARGGAACCGPERASLARGQRQPETINGTLEELIDRGVREAGRVADRWTGAIVAELEGKRTAAEIHRAIRMAADKLDLYPFARAIERRLVHSTMTGALDSRYEADADEEIKPEEFPEPESAKASRGQAPGHVQLQDPTDPFKQPRFTKMPYADALRYFKSKKPVQRHLFEKLSNAAKARAFTVAGLASEHAIGLVQAELTRTIKEGSTLDDFADRVRERMQSAGFSSLRPSHVETVFRTNLLDAYNVGRRAEMAQPERIKLRPFWKISGVGDARQRAAHRAVMGWVVRADDPFWHQVGGPPWGYNDRCRVSSLSPKRARGMQVRTGAEVRAAGIPDKDFEPNALFPPDLVEEITA